jgi:hypothetical protein
MVSDTEPESSLPESDKPVHKASTFLAPSRLVYLYRIRFVSERWQVRISSETRVSCVLPEAPQEKTITVYAYMKTASFQILPNSSLINHPIIWEWRKSEPWNRKIRGENSVAADTTQISGVSHCLDLTGGGPIQSRYLQAPVPRGVKRFFLMMAFLRYSDTCIVREMMFKYMLRPTYRKVN